MKNEYLLLIIDAQKGIDVVFYWGGNRNNSFAEKNIEQLLSLFRSQKLPIIHVRHNSENPLSPLFPGQEGHGFKPESQPLNSEPVISKTTPSAFIGT
jgi:nicotinamidase-related amidase